MGLPIPNLDDKTFEALVKEACALIPRYAPEWTDHNLHDPGITLIELFAWLAEMQNYQLNRITDANCLKFLGLLGLQPDPVQPARVDVSFAGVTSLRFLEQGTRLVARFGDERIVFETEEAFNLVPLVLTSIVSSSGGLRREKIPANATDAVHFAVFGDGSEQGATFELGFDRELPGTEIQLFFDLFEGDLPPMSGSGEVFLSVQLAWEYLAGGTWRPLTISRDSTRSLTGSGRIVFAWPAGVDERDGYYWVRCRLVAGRYEISPLINAILLNAVPAVQIEPVWDEMAGTGIPGQLLELKKTPVIPGSLQLKLQDDDSDWQEVTAFDSSGPDDRHYTLDPLNGTIFFGNGLNGVIPKRDQGIRAAYRTTLAEKGNLPKGQIFLIDGVEGLDGINLGPATGGAAAESLEDAEDRAIKDLRTTCRAITAADYEELAVKTPGIRVARAKAIPGYHPGYPCLAMPGAVTVVVLPVVRQDLAPPIPGNGFLQTVFAYLDARRLVATDLHVIGPEYVTVAVSCTVYPLKRSDPEEVQKRVRKRLAQFLDPFRGGPEGNGWPFGRPVYPSEIYQLLDKTEGVDYATAVILTAAGYGESSGIIFVSRHALVVSGEHQVNIS